MKKLVEFFPFHSISLLIYLLLRFICYFSEFCCSFTIRFFNDLTDKLNGITFYCKLLFIMHSILINQKPKYSFIVVCICILLYNWCYVLQKKMLVLKCKFCYRLESFNSKTLFVMSCHVCVHCTLTENPEWNWLLLFTVIRSF